MTVKRRSVSLSKATRGDILHRFFKDVSKKATEEIKVIENTTAKAIYDIIYGRYQREINAAPPLMLNSYDSIPLPTVYIKAKKRARKKGSIEPTQKERFQFMRFACLMDMDRLSVMTREHDLKLPDSLPQYRRGAAVRHHPYHIEQLVGKALISKGDEKRIENLYVKACRDAKAIYTPIVDIMEGVIEILENVKTTKGLLDVWPECEQFLDLPIESSGALMKVDVVELNKALDGFYPPAEKSSGA